MCAFKVIRVSRYTHPHAQFIQFPFTPEASHRLITFIDCRSANSFPRVLFYGSSRRNGTRMMLADTARIKTIEMREREREFRAITRPGSTRRNVRVAREPPRRCGLYRGPESLRLSLPGVEMLHSGVARGERTRHVTMATRSRRALTRRPDPAPRESIPRSLATFGEPRASR